MTSEENDDQSAGWLKKEIAYWRNKIEMGGTLPKTTELLLHNLEAQHEPIISQEDDDMLALVINDALQNVDIEKRYPAFYLKMINSPELHELFVDALELLEKDSANRLVEPPKTATKTLPFLQKTVEPQPTIVQTAANKWKASWHLLQWQLDQLFAPPELAYRSSFDFDDEGIILLRSQFEASGQLFDMFLEAVRRPDRPSDVYLHLSTAMMDSANHATLPRLNAHLSWGEHHQTAAVDRFGRAQFDPFPIQSLISAEDESFAADLELTLEAGER